MEHTGQGLLARWFGPAKVSPDWRAFTIATIVAPLIFSVTGVLFMGYGIVVTIVAAVLSLPVLLLLGIPIAYVVITRYPLPDGTLSMGTLALSSLIALLLTAPLGLIVLLAAGGPLADAVQMMVFYIGCGLIAGPLEAVIFAGVYRHLARVRPEFDPQVFS